jgi:GNAT superfamily N-acetyltransferase
MDALAASHANLVDAIRVLARWQGPHTCEERAGALLVRGATRFPTPYLNVLLPVGAVDVEALVTEASAFFPDRRCMAWTRGPADAPLAERLAIEGWLALGDMPIMAIERDIAPLRSSLELREVRSAADLSHFIEVLQDAYHELHLPPPVTAKLFCNLADGREAAEDGADLVVAYDGTAPVAAAMALTRDEVGGLYWVGTRPEARGRGGATAVTVWATRRAFARGARCVTLQASQAGEPVYLRLGYREVARYGRYLSPSPALR